MTDAMPIYNPPQKANGVLILLHGLGASGDDLLPLAPMLQQWRVLCPNAPHRAVSINGGWQMPAWYDIVGSDLDDRQDESGIKESAILINNIIDEEILRGTPPANIMVGGFSQGAALAIYIGLRRPQKLAGIIALSGYMLLGEQLTAEAAPENFQTPIFQAHGSLDTVVLPVWATQCRNQLQNGGWTVDYHEYTVAHTIAPETVADINLFLQKHGN